MSKQKDDPLLPSLVIHDTTIPAERQQCLLKATGQAKAASTKPQPPQDSDSNLRKKETAIEEAKKRCFLWTHSPSEKQFLGQLILTFGKYSGKTFKWMLENDVGYVKYLLDKHVKETNNPYRKAEIQDGWLKDYFLKYVNFFPPVSTHLEMNVDQCVYGQGKFKAFTFTEMYEWYKAHKVYSADPQLGTAAERTQAQEAYNSVKQWLTKHEDAISSKALKRFRRYILDKERADTGKTHQKDQPGSASDTLAVPSTSQTQSASTSAEQDTSWEDDSFLLQVMDPSLTGVSETTPATSGTEPESSRACTSAAATKDGTSSKTQEPQAFSNPQPYEGWQKSWETGLPKADVHWLKTNFERGLFRELEHYKQRTTGAVCGRHVLKDDRMWFYPPECPAFVGSGPPNVDAFLEAEFSSGGLLVFGATASGAHERTAQLRIQKKHICTDAAIPALSDTSVTCLTGTACLLRYWHVLPAPRLPSTQLITTLVVFLPGTGASSHS